ncbi:helix-turn-helix domain-containing protein [Wukongibacter baidiensis]
MLTKRLRELRKEKKLTQNDVANKLGISQSAYNHYEKGIRIPDAITLKKLADILDVSTDYLLGRTNIKEISLIEGNIVPEELKAIGVDYMKVDKTAKEQGFTPEDIQEILETMGRINRKNNSR